MRTVRTFLVLTCVAAAALLSAVPADAAVQFRIFGRGWGHGIGMSQYGAKGFAERGYSAADIVKYYYPGSTIGTRPADASVIDVLLRQGMTAAVFEIDGPVTLTRSGSSSALVAGDRVTFKIENSKTQIYRTRGGSTVKVFGAATTAAALSGADGNIQTLFRADNGASGRHYRGKITVHQVGTRLSVINNVALESYLKGVVPGEMPTSWHANALQAQSIAARSYAIATRKSGLFDEYADTRSQMYLGIEEEEATSNAAVNATAGQVAKVGGAVIPTFFHSTSGGRTAAIEDVWGGPARSYLRSKADPYEVSPYSAWPERLTFSAAGLDARLGSYVKGSLVRVSLAKNPSQRVETMTTVGSGGNTTVSGSAVQSRLGLRSTWFRIERLSINSSASKVRRNTVVKLSGSIPTFGKTFLQVRPSGQSTWTSLGEIKEASNGTWSRSARITSARSFRLMRFAVGGPAVAVRVA